MVEFGSAVNTHFGDVTDSVFFGRGINIGFYWPYVRS